MCIPSVLLIFSVYCFPCTRFKNLCKYPECVQTFFLLFGRCRIEHFLCICVDLIVDEFKIII